MKKTILFASLTILLLALAGCGQSAEKDAQEVDEYGTPVGLQEEVREGLADKIKQTNCEDSGGTFINGQCVCPDETYGDNIPLYTFDVSTGQCIDAFGIPGGALGEEAKRNHPLND